MLKGVGSDNITICKGVLLCLSTSLPFAGNSNLQHVSCRTSKFPVNN